jgi:hypothetical protein
MPRRSLATPIIIAGLVAGTLDILDPIIFYSIRSNTPPIRIMQSVASGLLGRSAFAGGTRTAAIGLAIHFCIALTWAAIFVFTARAFPVFRRFAVTSGLIYGLFIYAVMNFLILPFTHAGVMNHHPRILLINAVAAIVFLVGLPISFINKRFA